MSFIRFSFAGWLLLMLLASCSDRGDTQKTETVAPPVDQNRFSLHPVDGNRTVTVQKTALGLEISGVDTPVVVFDLFATWCAPCRAELVPLSTLQEQFKSSVTVLGVSIEDDKDDAFYRRFAETNRVGFPLLNAEDNMRFAHEIADAAGLGANFPIPLIAIYKEGRLVKHYSGLIPEEMLANDLQQITKVK